MKQCPRPFIAGLVVFVWICYHHYLFSKPLTTTVMPDPDLTTYSKMEQLKSGKDSSDMFTVVMPTYKREDMLAQVVRSLDGLPSLKTILVLTPLNFSKNFRMPNNLSAPVKTLFIRDSLNERFVPFDEIETEAVLHMDDDLIVPHDVITHLFREWKSEKHRIVGISHRAHYWNNKTKSWNYGTCRQDRCSIVLTQIMFLHKFYSMVYSKSMPEVIHQKVDELMNCEDIAMNFLVADITKGPPKWMSSDKINWLGSKAPLHNRPGHYKQRGDCVNYFAQVYGYMPLKVN